MIKLETFDQYGFLFFNFTYLTASTTLFASSSLNVKLLFSSVSHPVRVMPTKCDVKELVGLGLALSLVSRGYHRDA